MTVFRQIVTKQGKMSGFSSRLIENGAFAIFTPYEDFASTNWYHKATAPFTSPSPFYTMADNMTQCHETDPNLRESKSAGQELSNRA